MTISSERTRLCLMRLLPSAPVPVCHMEKALRLSHDLTVLTLNRMVALGFARQVPSRFRSQGAHYTLTPEGRAHYERLRADHLRATRSTTDRRLDPRPRGQEPAGQPQHQPVPAHLGSHR